MKAVRFFGNSICDVGEVQAPIRKNGEVFVKVMSSALCGSENVAYLAPGETDDSTDGYRLVGHEMSGVVADPGESNVLTKDDKVVMQAINGCGQCYYCKRGTYQFCVAPDHKGGTHAQYISLPEKCVIKAPDDIDYDTLVLLGGDTVGVAFRATRQLELQKGQTIFVSGAGPIGLGVVALLKHLGCRVIVSEPSAYRREYVKRRCNADIVLNPTVETFKEELLALADGVGPETTIECSGNPKAQLEALEMTRCQGTVMFCGENYNPFEFVISDHIIHKELTVKGAFYYTVNDFVEIIDLYRQGLDVSQLISHVVPLDKAPEVIAEFVSGNTGKVIIHPQD